MTKKEYNHQYYLANRAKLILAATLRYQKNRPAVLDRAAENRKSAPPERKEFRKGYEKAWRKENRGRVSDRAREWRRRRQAYVNSLKTGPCLDCGRTFPAVCMDFDHRPGTKKVGNVSMLVRGSVSFSELQAEIAKCDLVCACCHRIRSEHRQDYGLTKSKKSTP